MDLIEGEGECQLLTLKRTWARENPRNSIRGGGCHVRGNARRRGRSGRGAMGARAAEATAMAPVTASFRPGRWPGPAGSRAKARAGAQSRVTPAYHTRCLHLCVPLACLGHAIHGACGVTGGVLEPEWSHTAAATATESSLLREVKFTVTVKKSLKMAGIRSAPRLRLLDSSQNPGHGVFRGDRAPGDTQEVVG